MVKKLPIFEEVVLSRIQTIRGCSVLLDRDLAEFYGVSTKVLNQAVTRNLQRFPEDFMFKLNSTEFKHLRSQFVTSTQGGTRYPPRAFTERGLAMLSSVLKSEQAIQVNIQLIRLFSRMKIMLHTYKELLLRMESVEKRIEEQDSELKHLFANLRRLSIENPKPRKPIGF